MLIPVDVKDDIESKPSYDRCIDERLIAMVDIR